MISHKHKFIFVHIPRTSGSSIENYFGVKYKNAARPGGSARDKHYNAKDIYDKVGKERWDAYFKFTLVRNPWDRVISMYKQAHFGPDGPGGPIGIKAGKSLKYFLEKYSPFKWEHGTTFHDYLNHGEMDFVGRFENRESDLKFISDQLGIMIDTKIYIKDKVRVECIKKHKHYTEYYDDETRQIVAEKYARDIEDFGYKFGG